MARIVRFLRDETPAFGVVDGAAVEVIDPHPFTRHRTTGETVPLEGLRLLAPVIPSKVVAVGRNYGAHAAELGHEAPDEPLLFLKPATTVVGPHEAVRYPTGLTRELHHEAELAVVIGRMVAQVDRDDARKAVYGFTAANDITARDLQRSDDQWTRAKGFDTFCPLGPAIATDIDPDAAHIRCYVDGELRQEGNTGDLIFDVPALVSAVSEIMTLLPGDVLLTGTPEGVGELEPGQTVRVEIDGIGILENPVVARD